MKMPKAVQPSPARNAMNGTVSTPPAGAGRERDERDGQHPPRRVQAEEEPDHDREAAEEGGAGGDPQRLGRDELLGVDGRGEDRVVRALELVLHERAEHRRKHGGEQDRRRDGPGRDELDVVPAADVVDERAEAEAEREQVDERLDDRGERRRAPVRAEVDDLPDENALERRALEAVQPPPATGRGDGDRFGCHYATSSPVSSTNTSSRFAGRRSPSGISPPLRPRIETLVPVRRVRWPRASAAGSPSASRSGGP